LAGKGNFNKGPPRGEQVQLKKKPRFKLRKQGGNKELKKGGGRKRENHKGGPRKWGKMNKSATH